MSTSWIADRIEHWPIERLVPYARNARTHSDAQIAQIAASIAEFGFTTPILAGSDGVIVAGHGRLAAARKLGLTTVPVVVLDHLTPTQRRALVIADNRIAENAGWDLETLASEIEDLRLEDVSLDLLGFSDAQLDAMFDAAVGGDETDERDADGIGRGDNASETERASDDEADDRHGITYPVLVNLSRPAYMRLKELRKMMSADASSVIERLLMEHDA
jgi:hypothetical protein